jgi:hypothetical protein
MAEENKEAIKETIEKTPEAQPQAPAAAPGEAAKTPEVKAKKEKPSNCAGCKKSIKKKRWYYRDGKYYCSKRCFKTTLKKDDKKEEPKA